MIRSFFVSFRFVSFDVLAMFRIRIFEFEYDANRIESNIRMRKVNTVQQSRVEVE